MPSVDLFAVNHELGLCGSPCAMVWKHEYNWRSVYEGHSDNGQADVPGGSAESLDES